MRVDHLVYGVSDLDAAAKRFWDDFGLEALAQATHGELGTANRIVPVGDGQYVELFAVADPSNANPLVTMLAEVLGAGDRFVGVCLEPDDFESVATRLGETPMDGARHYDDGRAVHFRLVGLAGALLGPERLPFVIEWGEGREARLGERAPDHRVEPGGIAWVEVGATTERLHEWVGGDVPALRAVGGSTPGPLRAAVRVDGAEVVIE